MARHRKEIRLLIEFLGYGMEQLWEKYPVNDPCKQAYSLGYQEAVQRVKTALTELYGMDKTESFIGEITAQRKVYFFEPLNREEYNTLQWLSDHGYDGNLLQYRAYDGSTAGITCIDCVGKDTWQIRPLSESQAWQWQENCVDKDGYLQHDFLACCGSHSLKDKLLKVLDSIV